MCLGWVHCCTLKENENESKESIPKKQIHLDERCGCGGLRSNYVEDVYRWSESKCTLEMHRTMLKVKDFNALFLNIYTSDI